MGTTAMKSLAVEWWQGMTAYYKDKLYQPKTYPQVCVST